MSIAIDPSAAGALLLLAWSNRNARGDCSCAIRAEPAAAAADDVDERARGDVAFASEFEEFEAAAERGLVDPYADAKDDTRPRLCSGEVTAAGERKPRADDAPVSKRM